MQRLGTVPLLALCLVMTPFPVFSQTERGGLRLDIRDPGGKPLAASVELISQANQIHLRFQASAAGECVVRELPFGPYRLRVTHQGFAPAERLLEIRSEVPLAIRVGLDLAPVQSRIEVMDSATLVDPWRAATVYSVGSQALREDLPDQMGRALPDLVNEQPGWLYEANGVLHPRGSEYDVQYVVNGLPITQNRSLAFAPPAASENVESMCVMTAGFPAEYGRKLGGVVEVNTPGGVPPGLHVTSSTEGGSFATNGQYAGIGYGWGRNQLMLTGHAGATARYLDPPIIANYTNRGSTGGFSAAYARDLSPRDRLQVSLRHDQIRDEVPNELVQQEAGQRQDTANGETSAQADYQRVVSRNLLFSAEGSVRQEYFRLWSNPLSTPVAVNQQRGFREAYGRVTVAGQWHAHNWKAGADIIANPVHETMDYLITDPGRFDSGTAASFHFLGRRTDAEPAAFVQDQFHRKNWNLSAGMRFDHYHFLVAESFWSPRVAVSHYFPRAGLLLHASYDRVFQTPAIENLLLASSSQVSQITALVLRLPVRPSRANYFEMGLTKGFADKLRLDANLFRRDFHNYSDDDTLLNTGVSFPIADASARIEGVDGKLEMPAWGRFSGFVSYANQTGVGQGPITGGLFIGAEAVGGAADNSRFRVSQDQRNTARARVRFQASKRLWLATDASYGSGLPVELDTGDADFDFLLAQYGPRILGEVDFARRRVRPSYSLDASVGVDLYQKEQRRVSLEAQGSNLTNHLNVINFASLFSGTALAAPRSGSVRLAVAF